MMDTPLEMMFRAIHIDNTKTEDVGQARSFRRSRMIVRAYKKIMPHGTASVKDEGGRVVGSAS